MGERDPDAPDKRPPIRRLPRRPLRPSAKDRHQLDLFGESTQIKRKNSIALPGVNISAEIEQINAGLATYVGNNRWSINNRTYVDKGNGKAFPESGEQIVSVPRGVLKALQCLIATEDDDVEFVRRAMLDPEVSEFPETVPAARVLYELWKAAKERQP